MDDEFFININNAQLLWYSQNMSMDADEKFESQIDIIEYLASFINADAVRKARDRRTGDKIESSHNVEDQIKNRDNIFDDPLVRSVGEQLKKVTNKRKDNDVSKFDIQSTLHKIIREQ